jgi:hypothetical protein
VIVAHLVFSDSVFLDSVFCQPVARHAGRQVRGIELRREQRGQGEDEARGLQQAQ